MTDETRRGRALVLLAGDWLALGLFVFLGQLEHSLLDENGVARFLRSAAELVLPWTVVALLMRAHLWPAGQTVTGFLARSLNTWLVAAPLALLIRALLRDQATIPVLFILVMLGLGGLFLLAWRTLYVIWKRRRSPA
ncbi:MAG TPA: DUF3054 family protein [Candidatus Sulfomarinibacteraceae bacterium]|nr:DUF3054 family protein [Candidatus Sulfomarinibacteraceae bacterium]